MSLASAIGASPRPLLLEEKLLQFVETSGRRGRALHLLHHGCAVRGRLCHPCDGAAHGARRAPTL